LHPDVNLPDVNLPGIRAVFKSLIEN